MTDVYVTRNEPIKEMNVSQEAGVALRDHILFQENAAHYKNIFLLI